MGGLGLYHGAHAGDLALHLGDQASEVSGRKDEVRVEFAEILVVVEVPAGEARAFVLDHWQDTGRPDVRLLWMIGNNAESPDSTTFLFWFVALRRHPSPVLGTVVDN